MWGDVLLLVHVRVVVDSKCVDGDRGEKPGPEWMDLHRLTQARYRRRGGRVPVLFSISMRYVCDVVTQKRLYARVRVHLGVLFWPTLSVDFQDQHTHIEGSDGSCN